MKKFYLLLALSLLFSVSLNAQTKVVTFVGKNSTNNQYVKLSKVVVTNKTANWSETLVYPDTTLILKTTGIADNALNNRFGLDQNRPNPFQGTTDVALQVSKAGKVTVTLYDVMGRQLENMSLTDVQPGQHNFRVQVAHAGIYFMTVQQNGQSASIKMIAQAAASNNHINYVGMDASNKQNLKNGAKGEINKPYKDGDMLTYQGFATIDGKQVASKTVSSKVVNTEKITLQFDPVSDEFICGTSIAVDIDGNTYNTILIGSQCWMTENMRTSKFADGTEIEFNDERSEKIPHRYLPNGNEKNVAKVGYLYNWPAVMNGKTTSNAIPSGVQGMCPDGWHVPSDSEYVQLFDYIGNIEEYICGQDNETYGPGIAAALCSNELWKTWATPCSPGAGIQTQSNNATGFSAMPAGCLGTEDYLQFTTGAYLWTTTEQPKTWQPDAFNIFIDFGLPFIQNTSAWIDAGYSVRCLKD